MQEVLLTRSVEVRLGPERLVLRDLIAGLEHFSLLHHSLAVSENPFDQFLIS